MSAAQSPFRLSSAHLEAFHSASHDSNPLHRDAAYARRSQFGRPVAYGMAGVLAALAREAAGAPLSLRTLRCEFRKPLFVDQDYEFGVSQVRDQTRLRVGRGPVDYLVVLFTTSAAPPPAARGSTEPPAVAFNPREIAAIEPQIEAAHLGYVVAPDALLALQHTFGLEPGMIPASQLAALLWMSYHVGMEMPGRQALFAEALAEFEAGTSDPILELHLDAAVFDERFNRFTVEARGPGIAKIRLSAFRRPLPMEFAFDSLPEFAAGEQPLRDKTVLVTGAARGFGAAMAAMCARAGARVLIHHRGDSREAAALRDALIARGSQAGILKADLEDPGDVCALAQSLRDGAEGLDVIISSASPPIEERQFLEQDDADIQSFVQRNLAITLATARQCLPLLRAGGQFVQISSAYVSQPPRGFSHYLAAKGAQEGLIHALAAEYRSLDFVVARLPRMLTDQTNVPFSTGVTAKPGEIAKDLINELGRRGPGNYRLVELPPPPGRAL